jgi:hypothetical protein
VTASQVVENLLQALTAGVLAGSIYGLMCVGLDAGSSKFYPGGQTKFDE